MTGARYIPLCENLIRVRYIPLRGNLIRARYIPKYGDLIGASNIPLYAQKQIYFIFFLKKTQNDSFNRSGLCNLQLKLALAPSVLHVITCDAGVTLPPTQHHTFFKNLPPLYWTWLGRTEVQQTNLLLTNIIVNTGYPTTNNKRSSLK